MLWGWWKHKKNWTSRKKTNRMLLQVQSLEDRLAPSGIPPTVTQQPSSLIVDAGQVASFSAFATGTPAPKVQWQLSTNGTTFTNIPGATSDTFRVGAQAGKNGDEYQAVFMNASGSATSHPAPLTVDFAPRITMQPQSQTVAVNASVSLSALANSNPAATVQWEQSSNNFKTYTVVGTQDTLSFTAPATAQVVEYRADFSNKSAVGKTASTYTDVAVITVDVSPAVQTSPTSTQVDAGRKVTFTASATGTPSPKVQWQVEASGARSFTNIKGATSDTLTFVARPSDNGNQYRAVFTNPVGSVHTSAANLVVDYAPEITTQPENQTVAVNTQFTLTAAANSNPAASVQWYQIVDHTKNAIPNATQDKLVVSAPSTAGTLEYEAEFYNTLLDGKQHKTYTHVAVITVDVPPNVSTNPPATITVNAGQKVTLTALATGSPAPKVQWRVSSDNGNTFTNIPGATSDTFALIAKPGDNGNEYQAVFTNPVGMQSSTVTKLTVDFVPEVTTQPASQTVAINSQVTLTAAVNSNPAATVQWEKSTDNFKTFTVVGTADTLSFTAPSSHQVITYRSVFTNPDFPNQKVTSQVAVITVDVPPSLQSNPSNFTATPGQTVTFTASATGTPTPTVQWQLKASGTIGFVDIDGATSDTLSFTAKLADNGNQYRAVFTNVVESVNSNSASLTVT